jgi:spermidine synthase
METYNESQPWGQTLYEIESDSYTTFNTPIQKVELITNPHFGRMLFLDGVLQSATADEHIYHEALVGAGMRPEASSVLIAGGAEGAVAREVLKWSSVTHVQMIDWDAELVYHLQRVEKMNDHIWNDSRFHYSGKDILRFCEETTVSFDTVFLDLLDIDSEKDEQTTEHILKWIKYILKENSILVMNIGRSKETAKKFAGTKGEILEILVPSFQEPWYLVKLKFSL